MRDSDIAVDNTLPIFGLWHLMTMPLSSESIIGIMLFNRGGDLTASLAMSAVYGVLAE